MIDLQNLSSKFRTIFFILSVTVDSYMFAFVKAGYIVSQE